MSGPWLDLGSGGGFPALPVKLVLPDADLTCVERNARKAAFLRHAIGRLGLAAARVVRGTFPEEIEVDRYAVVTARAVERPEGWLEPVLDQLAPGAVFLNQTGHKPTDAGKFHVERIEDMWRQRGWRRGQLQTIRKRA
jgi:16S rRNA (guanine527-N7)-methyltransferase